MPDTVVALADPEHRAKPQLHPLIQQAHNQIVAFGYNETSIEKYLHIFLT
jgi:hypothetical protein